MLIQVKTKDRRAAHRSRIFGRASAMNPGKPTFSFTPHEAAQLMDDIGRTDVAAVHFVADVEACLEAFEYAAKGGMSSGMPKEIGDHLFRTARLAAELRSALYELPGDVAMLLDLHLLSDGARRRITEDFSQIVEPLEDLTGGIAELSHTVASGTRQRTLRLEDHLVRAIATAFRNRLNRKPEVEVDSAFALTLRHILENAAHRLPAIAESCAAITPARLRGFAQEHL
jgi:hypothetical protein